MTIPPVQNSIPATPVGTRLSFFRGEVFATLIILALGLCGAVTVAHAQQPKKVPRICLLSIGADPAKPVVWLPFLEKMREFAYIEGPEHRLERRFGEGNRQSFRW